MHSLVTVLTLIACLAICARLLTYKRGPDARHRVGVGLCAWLLIVCTGGQAIHIALVGAAAHVSPWQLGVLLVLAVLTYRARGNVARILRVD
ncbi:phage holin family protein [Vulcaniibacterium tengchongense]|uniref:Putative 3TM holin n=1 Tax=Vulcaniibacterium tengchongense TaxID=1273429 RepID=A0A3N4VL59_9GAMM|nr:phage holin family protein [Vulcaniibacterium tengchongense]RPE74620.1 putative 3TM holin [Vulcaniibacterium tengchongense]